MKNKRIKNLIKILCLLLCLSLLNVGTLYAARGVNRTNSSSGSAITDASAIGWYPGDLHVHSHYSKDLKFARRSRISSMSEMIKKAEKQGLKWLVFTDHSEDLSDKLFEEAKAEAEKNNNMSVLYGMELGLGPKQLNGTSGHLLFVNPKTFHSTYKENFPSAIDVLNNPQLLTDAYEERVKVMKNIFSKENDAITFLAHPFGGYNPFSVKSPLQDSWFFKVDINENQKDKVDFASLLKEKKIGLELMNGGSWRLKTGHIKEVYSYLRKLTSSLTTEPTKAVLKLWDGISTNAAIGNNKPSFGIGASDAHADLYNIPGLAYTYIKSNNLKKSSILESLSSGRAVVSNGPFMTISAENDRTRIQYELGDTVDAKIGDRLRIRAVWKSKKSPIKEIRLIDRQSSSITGNTPKKIAILQNEGNEGQKIIENEYIVMGNGFIRAEATAPSYSKSFTGKLLDGVAFTNPIFIKVADSESTDIDTSLVFDVSSSMAENWHGGIKIDSAKQAGKSIVEMIESAASPIQGKAKDRVGIVTFSADSEVLSNLTSDYDNIKNTIQQLAYQSSTNIGAGIESGISTFDKTSKDRKKIIIILSDGMTNTGLTRDEIMDGPVREAIRKGVVIYTIGFGDKDMWSGGIDEQLLKDIAAATSGEYYYAGDATKLETIYSKARLQSIGPLVSELSGSVSHKKLAKAGTFEVPLGSGELHGILNWPGSKLTLKLTDPEGIKVDTNYTGAQFFEDSKPAYYVIKQPKIGNWQASVYGDDISEGSTNYDVAFSVRPNLPKPPTIEEIIKKLPPPPETIIKPEKSDPNYPISGSGGGSGFGLFLIVLIIAGFGFLIFGKKNKPKNDQDAGAANIPLSDHKHSSELLFVWDEEGLQKRYVSTGTKISIGRSSRNDICLRNDKLVSANHAEVKIADDHVVINDLGSTNHTYVNDRLVDKAILKKGDRIKVGETIITFKGFL